MLQPYKTVLRLPGTLRFSASGLVARLPIPMVALGIVLLVSARTGSYGIAGFVSAAYVVMRSGFAPWQARVVDRYGQHRTLPVVAFGHAAALGGLVVVVQVGLPVPFAVVLSGISGACSPMIGSYVRARWSHVLGRTPELQSAFALEAIVDELLFMIGPPVVTFLATGISSTAGILVAAACGLVGTLALAAARATEPPARGRGGGHGGLEPLGWRVLLPVVIASACIGTIFGGFDISVIALATEHAARAWSGVLLAIWASGSMLAALVVGNIRWRRAALVRFRIGSVALACTILPLPFIGNLGVLALAVFAVGVTISPTMIASATWIEEMVPSSRLSEGLAWTNSALVGGIALGTAIAGRIIDQTSASTGFLVSIAAGVLAAGAAWSTAVMRAGPPARLTPDAASRLAGSGDG